MRLICGLIRSRSLSADTLDDRDHPLMQLRLVPLLNESDGGHGRGRRCMRPAALALEFERGWHWLATQIY